MTVFGGAGGRANEGRMQVDGLNTGAALNGGGVSTYVADISNAAGSRDDDLGRPGRSRSRRPDAQHRAEERRQHRQGRGLPVRRQQRDGRQQLQRRAEGRRSHHPRQAPPAVGLHGRRRRADHQGSPVVLRHAARRRTAPVDSRHLPEPERRRPDEVHLRARPDEAGAGRRELPARQHPADGADHAAQQVQLPPGPAVAVQRLVVHAERRRLPHRSPTRARSSDRWASAA